MARLAFIKRRKFFIPVAIIVLFLIAVYLSVRNLNAPAEGTINQTPPDKLEKIDPYANPGTYNGKYISFTYPAHYKKVPSVLTGSYLEVVDFYTTNQNGRQISVGVMPGSLADNSGVDYRKQHTELYTANPRTQNSQSFSAKSGAEVDDFIEHGGMVVSIAITSQNPADLSEDYSTIVSSLRWK